MQNGTFSPNETSAHRHPPGGITIQDNDEPLPLLPRPIPMSSIDPSLHPVTPDRRRTPHTEPEPEPSPTIDISVLDAIPGVLEEDDDDGSLPESPSEHLGRRMAYKVGQNNLRHTRRSTLGNLPHATP